MFFYSDGLLDSSCALLAAVAVGTSHKTRKRVRVDQQNRLRIFKLVVIRKLLKHSGRGLC